MLVSSFNRSVCSAVLAVSISLFSPSSSYAQSRCSLSKDLFLNPFSADSAHHRPIGTGALYASDSHPATRDWLRGTKFGINKGDKPWGLHMTAADGTEPVLSVGIRPGTKGSQLPASVRFPKGGVTIDFPAGNDGNIAIFDRSANRFQHIRNYTWNGGKPLGSQYRSYDPRGLGHPTRMGERIGTSASGVAAPFGILRGHEINEPGHSIDHALQAGLPRRAQCNAMLSRKAILPASGTDGDALQGSNNLGNIPYGGLLALPPSVDIDRLGLSEPGRRLALAIRNYGIYAVDGGGCPNGAIRADQDISSSVLSQLNKDIPKIYRHIRLVLNSEWRPGLAAVGGGQPIAPNCAFNAGATSAAAPSTGQSSASQTSAPSTGGGVPATGSVEPPSQQQATLGGGSETASGNVRPQEGTQAARDWEQAVKFWNWAQMAVRSMQRFAPGTPQYNRAKANYDRTINNYIRLAARAGIQVTAQTSPDATFG